MRFIGAVIQRQCNLRVGSGLLMYRERDQPAYLFARHQRVRSCRCQGAIKDLLKCKIKATFGSWIEHVLRWNNLFSAASVSRAQDRTISEQRFVHNQAPDVLQCRKDESVGAPVKLIEV